MNNDEKNQQTLAEYEKEKLGNAKKVDEFKNQGRVPDQQHQSEEQENLRK